MDAIKKALMIIGLIATLYFWKTYAPGSWHSFWSAIFSVVM